MKQFLKKRWHGIPVGIVSGVLALVLVAGGAFAAYGFLNATLSVEVEEAIAVGTWDTWDNLEPYGSVDDVDITLGGTAEVPEIIITTAAETPYVGEGFVAGEYIVIPVNIRSGSDGSLNLSASVTGGGGRLALEYLWRENTGTPDVNGCDFSFVPSGTWAPLSEWNPTISGPYGESGSAKVGAKVLFVRVSAPGDVIPGNYTFTVTLSRS